MKKTSIFAAVVLSLVVAPTLLADLHGAWTVTRGEDGWYYLNLVTGQFNNWGQPLKPSDFPIDNAVMNSVTAAPAKWEWKREAGTISFEGTFKNGQGAGLLDFHPNPSFTTTMRELGIADDFDPDANEDRKFLSLALADVSSSYARTMKNIFPSVTIRELRKLRGGNVTPAFIADMRAAGLTVDDAPTAARLGGSGVTLAYIRELRDAGLQINDAHEVSQLRGMDVTAKYIKELAAAGYTNLTVRQLRKLAASGVTTEYIKSMNRKDH